jgi:hypothetical protein
VADEPEPLPTLPVSPSPFAEEEHPPQIARNSASSPPRSAPRPAPAPRSSSTGAVAPNREAHAPGAPEQHAAQKVVVNEPEIPIQHLPEAAPAPNPPGIEPIPPIEAPQQASKAAPRGSDASVAVAPSPVPRAEVKPTPVENPTLPLEAKATIGEVTSRGSMPTSLVRRAIERINPQLAQCYARTAQAVGKNGFGSVTVEVDLDERGRARSPSAHGGKLSGLNDCVAEAAGKVISDRAPDTGTIHASFKVIFSP